jgi:hypothetical protein
MYEALEDTKLPLLASVAMHHSLPWLRSVEKGGLSAIAWSWSKNEVMVCLG